MSSWRLQVFAALICIILLSNICLTLASDDEDDDDEIIYKNVRKRKLVTPLTTARSILREHDKPATDTTTRSFPGVTLGYVTPWHGKGFEIAKKYHCKFDIISPTWFQLVEEQSDGNEAIRVNGDHDINKKWLQEMKKLPKCAHRKSAKSGTGEGRTLIMPRYLVEGWTAQQYARLYMPRSRLGYAFIGSILNSLNQHGWDGIVLDAGFIHFRYPEKAARDSAIAFFGMVGEKIRAAGKKFILVIPAERNQQLLVNSEDIADLQHFVDYFSLMTYDYGVQSRGPNSPLSWFESSHSKLTKEPEVMRKILGGVNMYGYDVSSNDARPVVSGDILQLLKTKKPKIVWSKESTEHYFQYRDETSATHTVWFPTLNYINDRVQSATSTLGSGLSFWELGQGMDYFYDLL